MKNIAQKYRIWSGIGKTNLQTLILTILGLLAGLLIGGIFGELSPVYILAFMGALIFVTILMLRLEELVVTLIVSVHIFVDVYLNVCIVATILAVILLLVLYLERSRVVPVPRLIWLWVFLLVLAFFPTLRASSFLYGSVYYISVFVVALLLLWLGQALLRDSFHLQRFFQYMAILGTLIAIHTIIQTVTGTFLFSIPSHQATTTIISYFDTSGSAPGVHRAESFLMNADSNGTFFAIMVFIPLALFVVSISIWAKVLFLIEIFLMLLALLFTYSTGAWASAFAGILIFIMFLGRTRLRGQLIILIALVGLVVLLIFSAQISLLINHTSNPKELIIRQGAWETGIRVIQAFPWNGVGIGRDSYLLKAEPFRVPAQYAPLNHPHNSYIELAALGGIPVALVFFSLVFWNIWCAIRVWLKSDISIRPLLAAGIAIAIVISFNSLVNAVWTLAPLAGIGWLVLGMASSPLNLKVEQSNVVKSVFERVKISK